jgi:hypothetical protein
MVNGKRRASTNDNRGDPDFFRRRPEPNHDRGVDLAFFCGDAATLVLAVTLDRATRIAHVAGAVAELRPDSRLALPVGPWKPEHAYPVRVASIDCYIAGNPSGWDAGLTNGP